MKTIKIKFIILLILAIATSSCRKITKDVSTVVPVSYPTITLKGDSVISVGVGTGTYTDEGATGTDNVTGVTTNLTPLINNVNLTTPGFYSVEYSTKNKDGFTTTKIRLVLVTQAAAAVDISGTYARTSNQQVVHVTKLGTGLYSIDNVGGVANNASYIFPVFFGQTYLDSVSIPVQANPLGGTLSSQPGSGVLTITPTDTTFQYIILGQGFGTSTRVFSFQ